MGIGIGELLLILLIIFVLFGAGKLPDVMGQIGKSVKSLKEGLKDGLKEESKEEKKQENNANKSKENSSKKE
jgi:sec-independent protein translocase protein TatA